MNAHLHYSRFEPACSFLWQLQFLLHQSILYHLFLSGLRRVGAYLSYNSVQARVHPGHVASLMRVNDI